jgi:hypothetical protein
LANEGYLFLLSSDMPLSPGFSGLEHKRQRHICGCSWLAGLFPGHLETGASYLAEDGDEVRLGAEDTTGLLQRVEEMIR